MAVNATKLTSTPPSRLLPSDASPTTPTALEAPPVNAPPEAADAVGATTDAP